MRAYFVRHGESVANILEVIANRGLKYGLTENGRRQTHALVHRLKEERFTQILSSPLLRAVETAEILASAYGIPYQVADGLREFDCGEIEGRSDLESWAVFRALVRKWLETENLAARIPGGESYLDIQNRFFPLIVSLLENSEGTCGCTLLVGHGMVFFLMLPLLFANIDYEFAHGHPIENTSFAIGVGSADSWICQEWFGKVPPKISGPLGRS